MEDYQIIKIENHNFYLKYENQTLDYKNNKKMENLKLEYIEYFDYIRIISSFGVILIHVSAQNWYSTLPGQYEWEVFNFYDHIVRWSVPEFYMISGALFLSKQKTIKKIFKKNIMKIGISYIFWSLVYCIKDKIIYNLTLKKFILKFIIGHYHLWFLFTINAIYLIIPALFLIVQNKLIFEYILVLSFIYIFILRNIILYSKYFIDNDIINIIIQINGRFNNILLNANSFYFIFGYYLNNINIKNKIFSIIIYIFGIFGTFLGAKLSSFISNKQKKRIGDFLTYESFHVLIQSIAIFIFFKNNFYNLRINKKYKKIIKKIGKSTFGIYLIHPLLIEELDRNFKFNSLSLNPIYNVIFLTSIIFFISLILMIFLYRTPLKIFI